MNRQKAWIWPFFAVLIVFSLALSVPVWAQNDNWNQPPDNSNQNQDNWDQDRTPDPPSRVARLNFAQGSVSFQPGGEGDWVDAVPNRPLTSGDNLWTDRDSRAELHVGSTAIRLGSETSVTFLDLDDHTLQLRVAQGTTLVRMRHMEDDDLVEIDTPNIAFQVTRAGEFRVDVRPDGRTTILDVIHGRGDAIGGGTTYTVVAGQEASFVGDDTLTYDIDSLPRSDDFDRWAFDRDRREDQSPSANYVSSEMTGYEDLDDNGNWSYAGSYGPVWYPTAIPAGWAPYRFGHWVWVAPWGWTWVDDAPWGFAPFHYGRWCVIGGRWGWVPGPVAVHPVYAPALVAFVGGGGFNIAASFGGGAGVAWFPLAPGEVFVPSYHVSRAYVTQVNVTNTVVNVTKVTNVYNSYTTNNRTVVNRVTYVNQTAPNAVTAVSRDTFVNARPVARNVVTVQPRDIAQAPVTRMVAVEPVRSSVIGAGRPTTVAPPPAIVNRQVVAQRIPAAPTTPLAQRSDKLVARPVTVRPVTPSAGQGNFRQQPQGNMPPANRPEVPINREPAPSQPQVAPNRPQPAPSQPQPNQPAVRPEWQGQRPAQPQAVAPPEPGNRPQPETPRQQAPQPVRPEQPARPPQPTNAAPPQPQQQNWSHPQARPAPPVQEKTEQQAQQDEAKYRNWQQKQQVQKPEQKPAPQPPKPEDKKDNKDNKKQR
jgi:hypothetical protein